ncbi:hypothetical protein Tco_0777438 [Tanacetum coccineum]
MPPRRTRNINDVYERIMARMDERLDQFVDQFSNRMNDMMNLRRCGDRNGRRSEDEELGDPFFEGDCSSSNELGDHGVAGDDYEGAPVFDDGYEEAPIFDDDQFEEESMPVYDTDIEDVIEEEEVFIEKGRFGGKEDNIEDVVVMANDLYSSMIQTTCVNFSKIINSNPHELIWFQKVNLVEVSILIGKKYHEGYLKDAPMDDKLGFKTIKENKRDDVACKLRSRQPANLLRAPSELATSDTVAKFLTSSLEPPDAVTRNYDAVSSHCMLF